MALAAIDDFGNRWGPLAPGFQRIPFGAVNAADRELTQDMESERSPDTCNDCMTSRAAGARG
jgi:hypothetical protein